MDSQKEMEEYQRLLEQQARVAERRAAGFEPTTTPMMPSTTAPPPPPTTTTMAPHTNGDSQPPPPPPPAKTEQDSDRDRRRRSRSRSRSPGHRSRRDRDRGHDRDRHSRRRRRSRSRSRERRHRSRSPSRRDPPRSSGPSHKSKRLWPSKSWDFPALGYAHMNSIEYRLKSLDEMLPPPQYTQTETTALLAAVPPIARQLVVRGFSPDTKPNYLKDHFNEQLTASKLVLMPGPPISSATMQDGNVVLEFRSAEECTNCLVFNYSNYRNAQLMLSRPEGYKRPPGHIERVPLSMDGPAIITNLITTTVPQGPKVYIGNIPHFLSEEQVREMIGAFGELKSFKMIYDGATGLPKGYAFAEFMDPAITDTMIEALNGWQVGDRKLKVNNASLHAQQKDSGHPPPPPMGMRMGMPLGAPPPNMPMPNIGLPQPNVGMGMPLQPPPMMPNLPMAPVAAQRVLVLMNMVDDQMLRDDEEYEDICEDVREECTRFGTVEGLKCPRPPKDPAAPPVSGVGKIYVKYATVEQAQLAGNNLAGRRFDNKSVIVSYCSPEKFDNNELE